VNPPALDVRIRAVEDADLDVFFEHQNDPEAARMAVFRSRDADAFTAHWSKIRKDPSTLQQTVVVDGDVAGNVVSWHQDGRRLVGYWIGREYWGRGVATRALALFLDRDTERPLYAHVAVQNVGSIRVVEKCGFRRVPEAETSASPASPAAPDDVEEVVLVRE
jgi:RimJ/RimL family protein N-acetyltransferase